MTEYDEIIFVMDGVSTDKCYHAKQNRAIKDGK